MNGDAYAVARFVRRYQQKNGYAPSPRECGCTDADTALLVKNGVIELLPLYEGGPAIRVALTDKGHRMAQKQGR